MKWTEINSADYWTDNDLTQNYRRKPHINWWAAATENFIFIYSRPFITWRDVSIMQRFQPYYNFKENLAIGKAQG